ncbi:M48 family metalloprotease [Haloarcula pellucida]|uniref:Protease n=1 Tax=Haloarcula pellucida TaxID=1427151 RepID=A0A830GJF0_9EURY|nr:M48 family metalloprotease [Halomicroarcula pellucida]MBX0347066.1 M48 family metalloprotease [Halomicroarcula pellucida]GGN86819.1 protease [Halomicroarcula pellucida]
MRRLTRRILLTLSLLLAVDVAVVATVAYLLTPWLSPVRDAVAAALPVGSGVAWWVAVVSPALVAFVWAQLRYTRAQTLAEADAREVSREEYPDLHDRVQRLCQQADMTMPTLAVAERDVPNSFAVGTLGSATVVVSAGLLATLDGDELDAVLAHELMHVSNRDATVMTLANFLPALTNGEYGPLDDLLPGTRGSRLLVAAVGLAVAYVLSARFLDAPFGSVSFTVGFLVVFGLTVVLGGVLLGVFTAPVVVLARSLSRAREFAADRSAAKLTGNPSALVGALQTLDADATPTPETDKRRAYDGVRGLCFLPYGFEDSGEDEFHVETRSHPPTADRIERLGEVAGDL